MFGAHIPELIVILILALVVFGPKRLPEIAGSLGKGVRDFRKSVSGEAEHSEAAEFHATDSVAAEGPHPEIRKVS